MWVMLDCGILCSYCIMEGFGIYIFCLINVEGKVIFVCFYWKLVVGKVLLVWDEVQKLIGCDFDFYCCDLWEVIEVGDYLEFEFGL